MLFYQVNIYIYIHILLFKFRKNYFINYNYISKINKLFINLYLYKYKGLEFVLELAPNIFIDFQLCREI